MATVLLFLMCGAGTAGAEGQKASEAQNMLKLLNEFRTGDDTWYWNKDNTTWTTETGLKTLKYDPELEKVAIVRAYEIAVSFSHTRPDGSKWSTAFPKGNYYKAENLAAGYETAAEAFEGLKEENEKYEGQGHRRNMLGRPFTRVGIAAVEIDGEMYWVQEFASGAVSGGNDEAAQETPVQAGWVNENGKYRYRNTNGSYATGWLQDGSKWYHFDNNGVMQTGWVSDGGKWYYFGNDGAMQTGWISDGGKWYYFDGAGPMQTGWQKLSGKWYYFDNSGVMQTGWIENSGNWYYAEKDGCIQTGWQKLNGVWYYFRSSGEMVTGTVNIDGQNEVFDGSGVWQYSEIDEYDTPLGTSRLIQFLRMIWQFVTGL